MYVSLENYTDNSSEPLTSPRSIIACQRLNIDPNTFMRQGDKSKSLQQLSALRIEFANIRNEGISETEFKSVGSPKILLRIINDKQEGNQNTDVIQRMMEKQYRDALESQIKFSQQSKQQVEQERIRELKKQEREQRDLKRLQEVQRQQEEMKEKINEKIRLHQEDMLQKQQKQQEVKEAQKRQAEALMKEKEDKILQQRLEKQKELKQRSMLHQQKLENTNLVFQETTKQKIEQTQEKIELQELKAKQLELNKQKEVEARKMHNQQRLQVSQSNVQKVFTDQMREAESYREELQKKLIEKELNAVKNKVQIQQKFASISEQYSTKIQSMNQTIQSRHQSLEKNVFSQLDKEKEMVENAEKQAEQQIQEFTIQKQQKFQVQHKNMTALERQIQQTSQIRLNEYQIRMNKADHFVKQKEQLKNLVIQINAKSQAVKSQIEFDKYYGVDSWKWKIGIVESPTQIRTGSPQKAFTDRPNTLGTQKGDYAKNREAILKLNRMMEEEEKREQERVSILRNASPQEKDILNQQFKQERLENAKKLELLRQKCCKSVTEM